MAAAPPGSSVEQAAALPAEQAGADAEPLVAEVEQVAALPLVERLLDLVEAAGRLRIQRLLREVALVLQPA
jgi:hypothetical protein